MSNNQTDKTRFGRSALETQVFRPIKDVPPLQSVGSENGEPPKDFGFGSSISGRPTTRLLQRDGSFNVKRVGYSILGSNSLYIHLLTVTWPIFFVFLLGFYLITNLCFGILYYFAGADALGGLDATTPPQLMLESFFFSVQTFATIGYGKIHPVSLFANILVSIEALFGMLAYAVGTGLIFARFSRPSARIKFSEKAIIAPYRGKTAFEFRIVNERQSQIIDLRARVILSRLELDSGGLKRKFHELKLEREQVMFFPLNWTIVHPIDETSHLFGMTKDQMIAADVEFLVLLEGLDDTFSQLVNARSSYKAHEIVWGAKFVPMLDELPDGSVQVDTTLVGMIESAALPS